MGITLPQPGQVFFPEVPRSVRETSPELYDYLSSTRRVMNDLVRGLVSNDLMISTAINLGTSGTFALSSGGSIILTSGLVITVTS